MEHNPGDRVDHGGEGSHGKNIAGDFDGAFFGGALNFLNAFGMRHRADVPDVAEDGAGVGNEERGKLPIIGPGLGNSTLVNLARGFVEEKRDWRNVSLRTVQADIALALLFGIIERMRVKKGPDELAADVFEAEFEMGMLENGVVAAVKSGGADVEALLICDFVGSDEMG